ncbi:hypothetical protein [Streptomyces rishiriensis]|uniref:hypothetical protein n=1 Tax=Streptomyces rishiriensis TaxID=68264 RepID=UPI000D599BB0|nr:hypothetical protein [Streptomyces rishiriensis]
MTITGGTETDEAAPVRDDSPRLVRGFLAGAVGGGTLAALGVGYVVENGPLFHTGLGLPLAAGVIAYVAGRPRRARQAAVVPVTALARIESVRAESSDTGNVPLLFVLTVAPDGAPAFRVETRLHVNLVDLPAYRPRGTVVVAYPPDRPWRTKIVEQPEPEWAARAADAAIDSAPESALAQSPSAQFEYAAVRFVGLLLAAAVVVVPFRGELLDAFDAFGSDVSGRPSATAEPSVSTSSSSSTTSSSTTVTSTSMTGTVTVGPRQSLLDEGELRRAVASLTKGRGTGGTRAITVVVQERIVSVVFAPDVDGVPRFDLNSLPYDRIPALVEQARTTLGAGTPATWQLTAARLTGPMTLRVTATGPHGTATLDADAEGDVTHRTPAG